MSFWRASKTSLAKLVAPSPATRSGASLFARSYATTQLNSTIIKGPKTPEELERQKVAAAEENMSALSRFFVKLIDKTGFGNWYLNSMGYRKYGLKFEDLLVEYPDIQEAVKRLPKEEQEARMKRIQLAIQLNGTGKILPKEQWTSPEQDRPYLRDYILQIQQEVKEREAYRRK